MIKTLSPYYLNIPFIDPVTTETAIYYTLKIYVWDGLKASVPTEVSYQMTKNNPTGSTGFDKVNIARLLNDYINFNPIDGSATGLVNASNQRWAKMTLTYTVLFAGDVITGDEQDFLTDLVLKGYSYGMDGENGTIPSNRILLPNVEFKVNRTGVFNVPVKILEV